LSRIAGLRLQERLQERRRLVVLAGALVHPQEPQRSRAVLGLLARDGLVQLFGLVELPALLERLAIEERDGRSAAFVENLLQNGRGFLRFVQPKQRLRVGDGARRLVGVRLVRFLQRCRGFLDVLSILCRGEQHLSENALRPGIFRSELHGPAGLFLGLRIDRQVAQQLGVLAAEVRILRVEIDGLPELLQRFFELAVLGHVLALEVVLDGVPLPRLFRRQRFFRRHLGGERRGCEKEESDGGGEASNRHHRDSTRKKRAGDPAPQELKKQPALRRSQRLRA
jgi:hypothetical protein